MREGPAPILTEASWRKHEKPDAGTVHIPPEPTFESEARDSNDWGAPIWGVPFLIRFYPAGSLCHSEFRQIHVR